MRAYDHKKIEKKWQNFWTRKKIYRTQNSAEVGLRQKKFFVLDMFPYPSGEGLHVGHPKGYIATDVISRMKRMQGHNILHPMGFDAFGLPAENFALKKKIHPEVSVKKNIKRFKEQLGLIGLDYDWSREVNTTDPKYYKWTQWIFLQLLKKGLAFESFEPINWCPSCKTGLANEDLEGGRCERCGSVVEKKPMRQWVLKITDYAERLLADLDLKKKDGEPLLDWPEAIKEMQRNWIGKSEGVEIEFQITNPSPTLPEGKGEFGYYHTDPKTWRALQDRALEMRQNSTIAEEKLWKELKGDKLGCHFRRQHIIGRFIVDFVCLENRLVVEVDGDIHDYQKKEDEERTKFLEQSGFKVVRFKNQQVISKPNEVAKKISDELKVLPFGEDLGGVLKVFSTRVDTIFGVTFLAIAPEIAKKITGKDFGINTDAEKEIKEKIGVDTGLRAKNPANGEEIPVWVVNYVSADYGTGVVMGVPGHDERDFEFAKKYNLSVREVVLPLIVQREGEDAVRKDLPWKHRNAVVCIIKHWSEEKYLCLQWKKLPWKGFVVGGIEEGEDAPATGLREIKEETGYKNAKFIKTLGGIIHSQFYQFIKKENRWAHFKGLYFELTDGEREEISEEEKAIHDIHWISRKNVKEFLNVEDMRLFWQRFQGETVYTGGGVLTNSGKFDGLDSEKVKKEITKFIGAKEKINFKLRDWVFSRQRYWGEPIPVIHCADCGVVPVPEKDLPVKLPKVKSYEPTGTGESPLANISKWVNVKCPKCKGAAKRETNTMPQWAGSSWYYLRYMDPKNSKALVGKKGRKILEYSGSLCRRSRTRHPPPDLCALLA